MEISRVVLSLPFSIYIFINQTLYIQQVSLGISHPTINTGWPNKIKNNHQLYSEVSEFKSLPVILQRLYKMGNQKNVTLSVYQPWCWNPKYRWCWWMYSTLHNDSLFTNLPVRGARRSDYNFTLLTRLWLRLLYYLNVIKGWYW